MSRSKKKRKKEALLYMWGTLVFVALALAGGFVYYYAKKSEPPKVAADGCPVDSAAIAGHTVIVIDKTDRLSQLQRDSIEVDIRRTIIELPSYHRVSIFSVSSEPEQDSRPILSLCSPRTFDAKKDNDLVVGKEFLQRVWATKFEKPIMKLVNELASGNPADSSPIFEMMQIVAVNGFDRFDISGKQQKDLYIYSDFLHHTKEFSLYQRPLSYDRFKKSSYGMKVLPKLNGVSVHLRVLVNRPGLQRGDLVDFWRALIPDRGGKTAAPVLHLQG